MALRDRAIVIGGSMAGLLTAKMLAEHYRDVLLIERDHVPATAEHRRGVPQSRHSHVLLASGLRALEALFPGILEDFSSAGVVPGDVARDVRWYVEGGRFRRSTSKIEGFGVTRPFLEHAVRARLANVANVRLLEGTNVDALTVSPERTRITGVRAGTATFEGDLVVDTGGRGSRTPGWLEDLGYRRPIEERVGIELRYTTRLFVRRPGDLAGDEAVIVTPTPAGKRGGGMVSQEGDRWIVTLITHFDDFAPADLGGFVEFSRTLPTADIYDVIRDAEPVGDAHTIRVPASIRRRYEALERFPAGFLVLGDAISSFNPLYGQGMSVAALEVRALDDLLRDGSGDVRKRFFRRAAKIVDAAWRISTNNDLRMPEATGRRPPTLRIVNWYVAKLLKAGHQDARAATDFLAVTNLLAPPQSLLRPPAVARVIRQILRDFRLTENGSAVIDRVRSAGGENVSRTER